MFDVIERFDANRRKRTVYATTTENCGLAILTKFLIYDDDSRRWCWVYADDYVPA